MEAARNPWPPTHLTLQAGLQGLRVLPARTFRGSQATTAAAAPLPVASDAPQPRRCPRYSGSSQRNPQFPHGLPHAAPVTPRPCAWAGPRTLALRPLPRLSSLGPHPRECLPEPPASCPDPRPPRLLVKGWVDPGCVPQLLFRVQPETGGQSLSLGVRVTAGRGQKERALG